MHASTGSRLGRSPSVFDGYAEAKGGRDRTTCSRAHERVRGLAMWPTSD